MKIVYLSYIPLTAKVAREWYIDYLMESGIDVEFWDVTDLLRGKVSEHYRQQAVYVREIDKLPSLESAIVNRLDAVFVLLLPKIWRFRSIFRLLSHYRCKTVIVKWGAMPAFAATSRTGVLHLLFSPRLLPSKIMNRLYAFLLDRPWYVQPYDLVFSAGHVMLSRSEATRKTVPIGLCDYDQYSQFRNGERIIEQRYAVFLDIYLPYQSDLALVGMSPLDPATYFTDLHRFFSAVESRYDLEVVIAMHPKAQYQDSEYRGRKLIHGKTPELVKDAEFVICHASTSVSYAVLNRKPVWIIFTDEMVRLYEQNFMGQVRALASYLNMPLLNISRTSEVELPTLDSPSEDRYAAYQADFVVTPEIKGGQSKEIFLKEICSLGA